MLEYWNIGFITGIRPNFYKKILEMGAGLWFLVAGRWQLVPGFRIPNSDRWSLVSAFRIPNSDLCPLGPSRTTPLNST